MWATLAMASALNLAPAQAGIEFKNVRPTYGFLGQERKDTTILPGDVFWLAFDIEGLTVGKDDRILYGMGLEVLNSKGESQYKRDPVPLETINTLGSTRVPAFTKAETGTDTAPGEYTIIVTVVDRGAAKPTQAQLKRTFEVRPTTFGMIRLGFYYSPQDPAPPVGAVGQLYLLNLTVVGARFDEKSNQPTLNAELTVTDESGKPTLNQPLAGALYPPTDEVRRLKLVPLGFQVSLNRAGKYKLTVTITDKMTNKKIEQSLDLTVIEPK
jgi:hypothetical protein